VPSAILHFDSVLNSVQWSISDAIGLNNQHANLLLINMSKSTSISCPMIPIKVGRGKAARINRSLKLEETI
jgi:hypothetical protein